MAELTLLRVSESLCQVYDLAPSNMQAIEAPDGKKYTIDYNKIDLLREVISFGLSKVEVKPSSVHGRGVFATRNIKKGELITFYPADVVVFGSKDACVTRAYIPSKRSENDAFFKTQWQDQTYCVSLEGLYSIHGNPNPIYESNHDYLGHFINDGAKPTPDPKSFQIYETVSVLKMNCVFAQIRDLHVAIVAHTDILKDQELFIHYGLHYWKSKFDNDVKK
jgi:SET domain-containing protein